MAPKPKDKSKPSPSPSQPPPPIEDLFATLNKHIQQSEFDRAVKVADQSLVLIFFPFLRASSPSFVHWIFREFFHSSYKIFLLLQFCLSLRGTRTLLDARSSLWLEPMISTRLCPPFSLPRSLLWISASSRSVFPGMFVCTTSFQCVIGYNYVVVVHIPYEMALADPFVVMSTCECVLLMILFFH